MKKILLATLVVSAFGLGSMAVAKHCNSCETSSCKSGCTRECAKPCRPTCRYQKVVEFEKPACKECETYCRYVCPQAPEGASYIGTNGGEVEHSVKTHEYRDEGQEGASEKAVAKNGKEAKTKAKTAKSDL